MKTRPDFKALREMGCVECPTCDGLRYVDRKLPFGTFPTYERVACPECRGSGLVLPEDRR